MGLLSGFWGVSLLLGPSLAGAPGTKKTVVKWPVGIVTIATQGALDKVAVWSTLRTVRPALARCHRRFGLGRRVIMKDRITLRFGIGRKGRPSGVRFSRFLPKVPAVARCFRRALFKLRFPKWSGRSPYVRVGLQVRNVLSRSSVAPIRILSRALRGRMTVTGNHPKPYMTRLMGRYHTSLHFCFDSNLKRRPALSGAVTLEVTRKHGQKQNTARMITNQLKDAPTTACILKAARRWWFPPVARGSKMVVRLRYYFEPNW